MLPEAIPRQQNQVDFRPRYATIRTGRSEKRTRSVQYLESGAPNPLEKTRIPTVACAQWMTAESDSMSNVASTKKIASRDTGRIGSS
jgi:hypothetical protein